MTDYGTLGLNENLRPTSSPAVTNDEGRVTGYEFNSNNERDAISATNIQNFSFSTGRGGTLTLGGTANGNGLMIVKDNGGTQAIQLDNAGIRVFGTSNFILSFLNGTTINDIGFFGASDTGTVYLQTGLGVPLMIESSHMDIQMGAFSTGTLNVNGAMKVNYGTAATTGTIDAYLNGTAVYALTAGGGGGTATFAYAANSLVDLLDDTKRIFGYLDGGDIKFAQGAITKTAIVPTSKGYNALYTNESPEVWFMDFCENKDKIDPMFLEVTEPPYHFIRCEGGEYQVWGIRKGLKGTRFEQKTQEQFERNNRFWAIPVNNSEIPILQESTKFKSKLEQLKVKA